MKSSAVADPSPRAARRLAALALFPVLLLAACARQGPPQTSPRTVLIEPEPEAALAELVSAAERQYWLGVDAQQKGDTTTAAIHFDAALQLMMETEIPPGQEEPFRVAFNDLVTRVHAQQLDDFSVTLEGEATDLPEDDIPALSDNEIELLRSRLEDTLPELPRYTVPMPSDNPRVLEALRYLTTNRKTVVEEGLARSTRYMPLILEVFAEAGLPQELAWIPLIESLFKPYVRSRASAVGLWQLMAPTAKLYGLRVDWYVDERRDPVKSTHAIAQFIRDYYREFGDWHLAIAAYNGGKGRVASAMRRTGAKDFWTLQSKRALPRETAEFVPKILAAMLIGAEPEAYGLTVQAQEPFLFDAVTIDSMTDLEVIADAAGTDLATIQDLNPQLLRRTTPNVRSYTIRVPQGRGEAFRVAYAAIPPDQRIRVVEHRIGSGETLSKIADRYDTSVQAISDLNGITNAHRIRAGHTLLIPVGQAVAPRSVAAAASPAASPAAAAAAPAAAPVAAAADMARGERTTHVVRRGENLTLIARRYGTSVDAIRRWNGLRSDRINQGQRLEVYYGTTSTPQPAVAASMLAPASSVDSGSMPLAEPASASDTAEVRYTIRRGDTLGTIASAHGVSVQQLRSWNGLSSDRIYPGRTLTIRVDSGLMGSTTSYTVRRGDTLTSIARRFGVTVEALCSWNGITTRTVLHPGNRLTIRGTAAAAADR